MIKHNFFYIKFVQYKNLFENIFSLSALQIVNYIIPLVSYPYLIRIIGIENIGKLAVVTAVTSYFLLISDFGFNFSATKQISDNRHNPEIYSKIFTEVLLAKLILVVTCFIFLVFAISTIHFFRENAFLFFLTFGMVIGQAIFPVWFFQGIEEMKQISIINIISKVSFTLAIFFFVKTNFDYWIVPLLTSLGYVFGGLYAFFLALFKFKIKFRLPLLKGITQQYVDGWHIFTSRIYVNLYSSSNIILLGFFASPIVVGNFSVAEKIIQAISSIFGPILQAFYPFLANLYRVSRKRFFIFFDKLNLILLIFSFGASLVALVFADEIVSIVTGSSDSNVISIFSILALTIISSPFGPSFTNGMLVLGKDRIFSKIVRNSFFLNFILILPLVYLYNYTGLAVTYVIIQYYTITHLYFILKNSKNL